MAHEVVFNSDHCPNGEMIKLACGYISLTKIQFINENIIVSIEAKTGEVDFYHTGAQKRLSVKVEAPLLGDEKFSEVQCVVEGEQIKLGFPQYTYEDNYPHCDGEHDRWTKTISGFISLRYDFKNNCILK